MSRTAHHGRSEDLSLAESASRLLDECRMVLPGIQALFGFQLIAVFNARFIDVTPRNQQLHLAAIGSVAMAVALIMTPAAYHRQTSPERVTEAFMRISSRLLLFSMVPLCVGIALDFYVIACFIVASQVAAALSAALFGWCIWLWFIMPRMRRPAGRAAAEAKR